MVTSSKATAATSSQPTPGHTMGRNRMGAHSPPRRDDGDSAGTGMQAAT